MAVDPKSWVQNLFNKASLRAYYAEFIGMVFFLFVSVGSVVGAFKTVSGFSEAFMKGAGVADVTVQEGFTAVTDTSMVLVVAFAFGISIMVLAYSIGHISGGHFNPAVTVACMLFGKIGPIKAIIYIVCQIAGATVGVGLVRGLLWTEYGNAVSWGLNAPAPGLEDWQVILMEVFGTAILTYVVFGTCIDDKATPLVNHMAPYAIGFTVFLAHVMLVPVDGCGINPARSTGSAIVALNFNKLWIYWVGPIVGGPFGAAIHYLPLQMGDTFVDESKAMNMDATDNEDNQVDTTGETPNGGGVTDKK